MNPNSLQLIADQLRQVFPKLGELEIAQLALEEARKTTAPQSLQGQTTSISVLTVGEIVDKVRERYLRKEKRRIRAKLEPDGSILMRNTARCNSTRIRSSGSNCRGGGLIGSPRCDR